MSLRRAFTGTGARDSIASAIESFGVGAGRLTEPMSKLSCEMSIVAKAAGVGVAACHHRPSCSQTSGISARIQRQWGGPPARIVCWARHHRGTLTKGEPGSHYAPAKLDRRTWDGRATAVGRPESRRAERLMRVVSCRPDRCCRSHAGRIERPIRQAERGRRSPRDGTDQTVRPSL